MFDYLLHLILIISCGCMGMIKSGSYSKRLKELNDIQNMLHILNNEITYRKDPLRKIFFHISSIQNTLSAKLLKKCAQNMDTHKSLEQCWSLAVEEIYGQSNLTKEDISILLELKTQLGRISVQGHTDMFNIIEQRVMNQIKEADNDNKTKGKMYRGLGFSIGIFISVLMI